MTAPVRTLQWAMGRPVSYRRPIAKTMDVHSRHARVSPILPSTPRAEGEQRPFARRLSHAIMMLAIAIPAHVWLVRPPDDQRPALATGSPRPAPVLSRTSQSPPAPRSAFDTVLASTVRAGRAPAADEPATPFSDSSVATGTPSGNRGSLRDRQMESKVHAAPVATSGRSSVTRERAPDRTGAANPPAAPELLGAESPIPAPAMEIADLAGGIAGRWSVPEWHDRSIATAPTPGGRPGPERAGSRTLRAMGGAEKVERGSDEALSAGASDLQRQEAIVRQVLDQYARAFERLDVQAAKAVWPTLDARALRRAFHQLDAQQLRFTTCGVSIAGQDANAHCLGDATYHPKVGGRPLHLRSREWTFSLSRHEDGWQIVTATLQ